MVALSFRNKNERARNRTFTIIALAIVIAFMIGYEVGKHTSFDGDISVTYTSDDQSTPSDDSDNGVSGNCTNDSQPTSKSI